MPASLKGLDELPIAASVPKIAIEVTPPLGTESGVRAERARAAARDRLPDGVPAREDIAGGIDAAALEARRASINFETYAAAGGRRNRSRRTRLTPIGRRFRPAGRPKDAQFLDVAAARASRVINARRSRLCEGSGGRGAPRKWRRFMDGQCTTVGWNFQRSMDCGRIFPKESPGAAKEPVLPSSFLPLKEE